MQEVPYYQGQSSSWSFTQGFLLGQISIAILIGAFIRFFVFGEVPSAEHNRARRSFPLTPSHRPGSLAADLNSSNPTHKLSSVIRTAPSLTTATILAKTYYNVNGHQPESVDWFNVLFAQTIAQLRVDAQQDNAILTSLTNLLNGAQRPDFLDEIRVTEINLGEEFPIFSNCRVIPVEADSTSDTRPSSSAGRPGDSARLQARMDVDLSDTITLGIETKLVLNYPKPFVAVMPVALAITVVRFSGTLSISFIPSPSAASHTSPAAVGSNTSPDPTPPTTLTFSFLPDYRLELSTHSLLGSRSRLQDVPKIAQLIEARLHDWFDERCVEPRFQQVELPSLWPRRSNTRGGDAEDDVANDSTPLKGKGKRVVPVDGSDQQSGREMENSLTDLRLSRGMTNESIGSHLRERHARFWQSGKRLAAENASRSREQSLARMPGSLPS